MKVAVYIRFAHEPQDDGKTIEQQELQLRQFADDHNLQVAKVIKEFGSGLNYKRPGLEQLVKDSGFQGVLTSTYDRIGRDVLKTAEWQGELEKTGKTLLCADGSHECGQMPWYAEIMKKSKRIAKKG